MPHFYSPACLHPLHVYLDEDELTYAVYRLPAPLPWRMYADPLELDPQPTQEIADRVQVCLSVSARSGQPSAIVIPYGPDGRLWYGGVVIMVGVVSYLGVLNRLGYAPLLPNQ